MDDCARWSAKQKYFGALDFLNFLYFSLFAWHYIPVRIEQAAKEQDK